MMKPCLTLSVCLLASLSLAHDIKFDSNLDDVWSAFKEQHNKKYESKQEDLQRREIWERNVETIKQHNLEYDLGLHTYTMGINEYSDLTFEEYRKYLLGADIRFRGKSSLPRIPYTVSGTDLPGTVDWRQEGYVTGVKNQGQCGSCWAFSSTGALEGQHYKHYKQLVSLSEQNLVDCCTANAGCNGGWMDNSFKYVMSNNGLDNEDSYPYEARDDTCRYNPSNVGTTCYGLYDVRSGDENALKDATAMNGPVSVAIDAAHPSFQSYKSGIYFEPACSQNATDHAVLVVGYGNYNGYDYWLVKNSWGTSWGENGYIKMARNYNNMCAIATYASYPLV